MLLFTQGRGKGGGEFNPRGLEGQLFTKLGRKYQYDLMYLQSIIAINVPVVFMARYVMIFGPKKVLIFRAHPFQCLS
jgi:hypothetical protein